MSPKDILRILKGFNQEQSEMFIQLQLDTAKLAGQIQGVTDAQERYKDLLPDRAGWKDSYGAMLDSALKLGDK